MSQESNTDNRWGDGNNDTAIQAGRKRLPW
jgi:hypothetical protein